ncbi:MAG: hypothetical protein M1493_03555 [Firmicutes bacterium]|jgi:uncharacterized protein (DUF302 family)|nr:hypothetical protein [Bacillota bacterium]
MPFEYFRYEVGRDPDTVVAEIKEAAFRHDLIEQAIINHRLNMTRQHLPNPPWAYSVILANPRAAATFFSVTMTAVTEMPIRLGIYGTAYQTTIIYHTMAALLSRHHPDLRYAGETLDALIHELCMEIGAELTSRELWSDHPESMASGPRNISAC